MIFAKEPPKAEIRVDAFMNTTLYLPAKSSDTAVDTAIVFDQDSHITALFPHSHLRGKTWEYRLVYPDGRKEVLLSVPNYDFNWQTLLRLRDTGRCAQRRAAWRLLPTTTIRRITNGIPILRLTCGGASRRGKKCSIRASRILWISPSLS